jgi:2-polyprenyl-3-methyl-5-hydroxy-6-metoxy-1,4-benzoquinol methylase
MKRYSILLGVAGLTALGGSCNSEPKTGASQAIVITGKAVPTDSLHHAGHHPGHVMDPAAHHPGQTANEHMHARPFEELVAAFDDPARAEWQQPEKVLQMLGPLKGKTVMDIGAGTGYFSFPLANAGAHVISADVDDRFLKLIEERRVAQNLSSAQLSIRKLPFDSPKLAPAEADVVLLVDVYHHLENRPAYFRQVRAGLKPGGRLVIIDFKKHDLPVGPPASMKMTPMEIEPELKAAGFERQEVEHEALPYQYIITAYK